MTVADFNTISKEYMRRKGRLLAQGKSQRPTSIGYWASADPVHMHELFRKLELGKSRAFLDLGSGDGVVVAIASLFTTSSGIEIDEQLHNDAVMMAKKLGLEMDLICMDYLDEDLSKYDFIFINPDNYFHKLERRLVEQFKGTLVIADNIFRPLTLSPSNSVTVRGVSFSVYKL
ncbi:hypothetical protein HQ545_04390 [Candidatus Woesearchaeota archaeon]|nr:hypothetical protein [Candidatus Woesearchaeota archaeon]